MARRYRVLGVVGRGGFGTVYRAKLEGQEGFQKDVAIKILNTARAKPKILARFRDEARMLGLARDRALVAVDPPTRMGATWAVVMEFVDGVPMEQLLMDLGPLPVGVVLEVTREVARSLDAVYHQRGPDGGPLRLLHRDLKPSNLQLTPTGEVKILDFGIARADFSAREAKTVSGEMAGTQGYMAPERLEGMEAPEGDVFSLGTVMRRLLTGDRPVGFGGWRESKVPYELTETRQAALAFAARCQSLDPEGRPSMREVEEEAHRLLRACDDPPLRRWAEKHVPPNRMLDRDDRVGTVLVEDGALDLTPAPAPARPPPPRGRATPAPAPKAMQATPPPAPPKLDIQTVKTVKPKTLTDEDAVRVVDQEEEEPPAAPARPSVLPPLLIGIPALLLLAILGVVGVGANTVSAAAYEAHSAEATFVERVRLEAAAIGHSLEKAGALSSRVRGDIDAMGAEPSFDGASRLVGQWERTLTELPPPDDARERRDRHELDTRIEELKRARVRVVDARAEWKATTRSGAATIAVLVGLAERPPAFD